MEAFANTNFDGDEIVLNYEDSELSNLLLKLHKIPEIKKIFDMDIIINVLKNEIESRFKSKPIIIDEKCNEEIVQSIIDHLNKALADHLIVCPIQYAQYSDIIKHKNYTFIPQNFPKNKKIEILSKLSKSNVNKTISALDHLEITRSPDFFKYPLLCIKQHQQTSAIHYDSLNISKRVVYSLRCFFYANIYGTKYDKTNIFLPYTATHQKKQVIFQY